MEREKKVFRRGLKKFIFCIIVSILFFRSIVFCQDNSPSFEMDQRVASVQFSDEFTVEVLNKHEVIFPSTLGQAEPDVVRTVPVPPVGVTIFVFTSVAIVGWLRRKSPSDVR